MGRLLHDQALRIKCTAADDPGSSASGVYQYSIRVLRAATKGADSPADTKDNFADATEIYLMGDLDGRVSYRVGYGVEKAIRPYDPSNEYYYDWNGWEDGYNYTVWVVAIDKAGNIEPYENVVKSFRTSAEGYPDGLHDTRAPQFAAYLSDDTRIPWNSRRKWDSKPWRAKRSGTTLNFLIQSTDAGGNDFGVYPEWHSLPGTNPLADLWFVFEYNSATYVCRIAGNSDAGGGQDQVSIDCAAGNYVYKIAADGTITLLSSLDLADSATLDAVVVVQPPTMTCFTGRLELEFTGVEPEIADLDYYEIKRYVANTKDPAYDGDYGFVFEANTQDKKYESLNRVWNKAKVLNPAGSFAFSDAKIYGRALYQITPVDRYGNKGLPTLTWSFTNVDNYFPATGTPPQHLSAVDTLGVSKDATDPATNQDWTDFLADLDDGDLAQLFDVPADDDLKGIQIARQRLVWTGTAGAEALNDPTHADWQKDSFEIITGNDIGEYEDFGITNPNNAVTYDKVFIDRNLEPFTPTQVAYRYRLRAFDFSGNTSIDPDAADPTAPDATWYDLLDENGNKIFKAVDVSVDTSGASLVATGKIGSIALKITQPTDNLSVTAHIYRSTDSGNTYEVVKPVELPPTGDCYAQDEYPDVDQETLLYYGVIFEDEWGNLSFDGSPSTGDFAATDSASSKTAASAGDSIAPATPDRVVAYFDEVIDEVVASYRRSNVIPLTGTVTLTEDSNEITIQGSSEATIEAELLVDGRPRSEVYIPGVDKEGGGTKNHRYAITSVESNPATGDPYITVSENVTELANQPSDSGLSFYSSQDYAGATLLKRRVYDDGTKGPWLTVTSAGSSQVSTMIDPSPSTGQWEYGVTAIDQYNNESAIATQGEDGFNNLTILTGAVNDVFIYNTATDTIADDWRTDETQSWFTSWGEFPSVSFDVVAANTFYIFNGSDGTLWNSWTFADTISSIHAINGVYYIGTNAGTIIFDFTTNVVERYDTSGKAEADDTIVDFDNATTWGTAAGDTIVSNAVNAVHANVLPDGNQYTAVGTDAGASIINESLGSVVDVTFTFNGATQAVKDIYLDSTGRLYFTYRANTNPDRDVVVVLKAIPDTDTDYTHNSPEVIVYRGTDENNGDTLNGSSVVKIVDDGTGDTQHLRLGGVVENASVKDSGSNKMLIIVGDASSGVGKGFLVVNENETDESDISIQPVTDAYNTYTPLAPTVTVDGTTFDQTFHDLSGTVLGSEQYQESDAASDPNGTEANSVGNWGSNTTGIVSVESTNVYYGSYALEIVATGNVGRGYIDVETQCGLVMGKRYTLSLYLRHNGTGGLMRIGMGSTDTDVQENIITNLDNTQTTYTEYTITFVYDGTQKYLIAKEVESDDGGIYIDNITIKPVEVDDVFPGSHNLSVFGNPTFGSKIGALPAVDFGTNNTDKYLQAPDAPWNQITDEFTIVCVADVQDVASNQSYLSKHDGGASKKQFLMFRSNSDVLRLVLSSDGSSDAAYRDADANYTGVTSFIGTYKGSESILDLFVNGGKANGTLTGTVPASIFNGDKPLMIGANESSDSPVNHISGKLLAFIIPEAKSDEWCENLTRILYDLATDSTASVLLDNNDIRDVAYDQHDDVLWLTDVNGKVLAYDILNQKFLKLDGTNPWITNNNTTGTALAVDSGLALAGGDVEAVTHTVGHVTIADTVAPLAPTDIEATFDHGRLILNWSQPGDDDIKNYQVLVRDQDGNIPDKAAGIPLDAAYTRQSTQLMLTNITRPIDQMVLYDAGGVTETTNYWQVQVTVYDRAGNSRSSVWFDLDSRASSDAQNADINNYQPASGELATSATELQEALRKPNGDVWAAAGINQFNGDAKFKIDAAQLSDKTEIELLLLEVGKGGTQNNPSEIYQVNSFRQRNASNEIDPPALYHATGLLEETDEPTETFQFRLKAITFGGMLTPGDWQTQIEVTDTTGPSISGAGFQGTENVGSVHLDWEDVIDKDSYYYKVKRSPDNDFADAVNPGDQEGISYETIAIIPSNKGGAPQLVYNDNDWDQITGTIPGDKTSLGDDTEYAAQVAFYQLEGYDRFGNPSQDVLEIGPLSAQYYAPAIPVTDDVVFFPFNIGVMSTDGVVPATVTTPDDISLLSDGKFGGGAVQVSGSGVLAYATSDIGIVSPATIDFFERHAWASNDSTSHYLLDISGTDANRLILEKTSGNNLILTVYGGTSGGYKRKTYDVSATADFPANQFNRVTIRLDTGGAIELFLNSVKVGVESSGGTWSDPTAWGTNFYIGCSNGGAAGAVDISHLTFWPEAKPDEVIRTWHDADRNFTDVSRVTSVPSIFNTGPTIDHVETVVRKSVIREAVAGV